MTRAWMSVFKMEFVQAFYFHPLFWTVPIGIFIYLFRKHIPNRILSYMTGVAVFLFIIVYIMRMVNPEDTVVVINFYESIIWDILKRVRELLW